MIVTVSGRCAGKCHCGPNRICNSSRILLDLSKCSTNPVLGTCQECTEGTLMADLDGLPCMTTAFELGWNLSIRSRPTLMSNIVGTAIDIARRGTSATKQE